MAGVVQHYEECGTKKTQHWTKAANSEKCPWCDVFVRNAKALALHQKVMVM